MLFAPNIVQMIENKSVTILNEEQKNKSTNFQAFIENDWTTGPFNVNFGVRGSSYNTGTKNYNYLEPRVALRFQTHSNFSANISYTKLTQFIHLLSNTSLGMPTDLWVASTDNVKPQKGDQLSAGIEKNVH